MSPGGAFRTFNKIKMGKCRVSCDLVFAFVKPYNPRLFREGLQGAKMAKLLLSWPLTTGFSIK